jgi:hypothetical protein
MQEVYWEFNPDPVTGAPAISNGDQSLAEQSRTWVTWEAYVCTNQLIDTSRTEMNYNSNAKSGL